MIGEALQRSAASFNAANTSLEGAISVITTANSVVQNPEAVGTAMKTLSARIRGSKVELEELGEEEEDVINLTSKLRREVEAMTGFDIMEDEDTYKSIDQIIIGIGKHWKELTDIQQAALAEDLAGKRNSNVLIALLQNAELVEEVYTKATHAAGSAAKEQQNYMMSIQYSLDRFTASMQELEADLVSSQLVKDIVDIGTTIVNFLDVIVENIGLIGAGASIAGIVALVKNFKELKATFEAFVEISKVVQLMQKGMAEQAAVTEALTAATESLNYAQAYEILTLNGVDSAMAKDILAKAGYTGATATATVSTEAFTAALLANVKAMGAWLVTTPVGLLVLAAAAVATTVVAFDTLTVSVEEANERVDKCTESIKSIKSELEKLRNLENKTAYDDRRISHLEKELKIQERLLEVEKERAYRNLTEKSFANSFDSGNIGTKQARDSYADNKNSTSNTIESVRSYIGTLADLNGRIDKLNNSLASETDAGKQKKILADIEKLEAKRDKAKTKGDSKYSALLDKYKEYIEQRDQLADALNAKTSTGLDILTGQARKDAITELDFARKKIEEITEAVRDYEQVTHSFDPFNIISGIASEDTFNEKEIANAVNSAGDLESAQKRLLAQFPSLTSLCNKYGVSIEELTKRYWKEKEAIDAVNEATKSGFNQSKFSEEINALDSMQSAYNSFVENATNKDSKINLDISDIESLRDTFTEIEGFDFDEFERVVTADTSNLDDIQNAFDKALTAYANNKIALEGISEQNRDMIRTQLELEGATHESAQAFVDAKLAEADAAEYASSNEAAFQNQLRESARIASLTKAQVKQEMDELQRGGSVDLAIRPVIDTSQLPAEWGEEPGSIATLLTNTFANEDATVAINFTPIMTDESGNYIGALTPDELEEYAWDVLHGAEDTLNLQIGAEFTGQDAIEQAEAAAERIHKLQAVYYGEKGDDHFAEFVEEDTYALIDEAEQLGVSTQALAIYKLNKLLASENPLDTSMDRAQLLAFVQMLGIAEDEVVQLTQLINLLSGSEIIPEERRQNIMNRINEIVGAAVEKASNIKVNYDFDGAKKAAKSGGSSAGKEAGDAYVKAFEDELKALEKQRDAGIISEKEFLEKYRALIEKYFKDVDGYGEEYAERMADYFSKVLSYYESVFSAVGTLLNKRINAAQEGKDAAIDALNAEKEAALAAYDAQIEAIDELIDEKKEQIDLLDDEIDAINDQVDAINEAADARKRDLDLQKAQYELQRQQQQRTKLVYKGGQLVYENDTSGVRDAKEEVENIQREMEIANLEKKIKLLEDQKELINDEIEALEKQKDSIEKAREETEKYFASLIEQTEKYWDSIIDALEKQKSKWEELSEIKEIANAYALIQEAGEELGYSVEDILNDVPGAFEAFRDAYLNVLKDANSGNQNFLDGLTYATGAAKDNVNASLDEIANKATDVSTALEPLSDVSTKVEDTATALGNVATNSGTAATNVGSLGSSLEGAASASEDISNIDSSVQNIANTSLEDTVQSFRDLFEALDSCAQALGIGEGEMSAFESALNAISEISLGDDTTGAIGAFTALAGAVDTVTSAISGGGSSSGSGDLAESKSESMSDGASGAGGLISAIEDVNQAAKDNIGTSSSVGEGGAGSGNAEDGGTVISDFDALYGAVNNVIEIIGNTKDEYSEDGTTLVNAVKGLPVVGKESIMGDNGLVEMFNMLLEVISKCLEKANELLETIRNLKAEGGDDILNGGLATGNVHVKGYATGNVHGNAYASGRLGLKSSENALVGEIGQELVYNPSSGTYRTVGDHGPEITRLQKGDLVFNAAQTKAIIKHGKRHGNSYANGSGLMPLSDAEKNMFKAMGESLAGIKADVSQMLGPVKTMAQNINKVTTNNTGATINISGTSFTVSGVTGEAVTAQIRDAFAGIISNAYQHAMK